MIETAFYVVIGVAAYLAVGAFLAGTVRDAIQDDGSIMLIAFGWPIMYPIVMVGFAFGVAVMLDWSILVDVVVWPFGVCYELPSRIVSFLSRKRR